MSEYYTMKIAGLERRLEKFPVNEKMDIAAFIIFGDVELTIAGCEELRKKLRSALKLAAESGSFQPGWKTLWAY